MSIWKSVTVAAGICFGAYTGTATDADLQKLVDEARRTQMEAQQAADALNAKIARLEKANAAAGDTAATPKAPVATGAVPGFLQEHFPSGITDANGKEISLASLKGKAVGIYFSAHWCPPCRAFTPKLVEYRNANKDKFEVVFVSSDRSAEKQVEYMKEAEMAWGKVAWRSDDAKALSEKYQVRGIPSLVLLSPDGTVFDRNGRAFVTAGKSVDEILNSKAATSAAKPAKPEVATTVAAKPAKPVNQAAALKDHFPEGIINIAGEPVDMDALKGKVVGMYFSAHWCGPCRAFTPKLVEYRNKYKDNFEVVFVSSDRSAEDQATYMKEANMPWPTMKFRSDAANTLGERYAVRGIPALILLAADGSVLSKEGRGMVQDGVDMAKVQAGKFSREKEEYKCGRCDKMHTREKIVIQ